MILLTIALSLAVVSVAYWLGRVDGKQTERDRVEAQRRAFAEMVAGLHCYRLRYEPTEETEE